MTIRRFAHPLAIALSVGAINYAFVPRATRPTTRTPTAQTLRPGVNRPRDVRHAAAATLGAAPAESPDLMTWWLPVAELAIVGAYLEVAASHWRGLTLGADVGPSDSWPERPLLEKALVMPSHELRLHLPQRVERDAHHDKHRGAAEGA